MWTKEKQDAYMKVWRIANREKLRAYEKVRSALPKNVEARRQRAYNKTPQGKATRSAYKKKMPPSECC